MHLSHPKAIGPGPFRAEQLRSGDPYELSDGHAIYCLPTGAQGSRAQLVGGGALESDPGVESAGIDTGFAPSPETLRAPDVAVGNVPDQPGWAPGAPALAVEYADSGQDEVDLAIKIRELLAAGTRMVWVLRLTGPRRVEVHEPGKPMRLAYPGEQLEAPGILRNPFPVEALYDRQAAHQVTLRNLLQRQGYDSLDEVQAEALQQAVLDVLAARGLVADAALQERLGACQDPATLSRWLRRAATVATAADVLAE